MNHVPSPLTPAPIGSPARSAPRSWLGWGIGILVGYGLIPGLFAGQSYVLSVLTTALMLGLISLGVWQTFAIGRINIAQGGFAMIGGYTTAILVSKLGWSFWLCLPLSGIVSAIVGFLIGWPILRLKGIYFSMLTLSLTEAIRLIFLNTTPLTNGASGMVGLPLPGSLTLGPITLIPAFTPGDRLPFYFLAVVLLTGGIWLMRRIQASRWGGVFRSLRQNEDLATSLGINVAHYRAIAFAICCFYGGVGGSFFTTFQQNIYPNSYQVTDSVYFMMYCFIGGLDYLLGPVVGALGLVLMFELLHDFQRFQPVMYAVAMIACMMVLPNGLLSLGGILKPLQTRIQSRLRPGHQEAA